MPMPERTTWIDTASGSRCRLDPAARTWTRLAHDPRSGTVRTASGRLDGLADAALLGEPLVILGPSLAFAGGVRVIETTPVTAIHAAEPAEPPRPAEGWRDA